MARSWLRSMFDWLSELLAVAAFFVIVFPFLIAYAIGRRSMAQEDELTKVELEMLRHEFN